MRMDDLRQNNVDLELIHLEPSDGHQFSLEPFFKVSRASYTIQYIGPIRLPITFIQHVECLTRTCIHSVESVGSDLLKKRIYSVVE